MFRCEVDIKKYPQKTLRDVSDKGKRYKMGPNDYRILQGVPQYWSYFIFCNLWIQNDPIMGHKGF